jgi:hypothetical protein
MQRECLQKPEPPSTEDIHGRFRKLDEHLSQMRKYLIEVEQKVQGIKQEIVLMVRRIP